MTDRLPLHFLDPGATPTDGHVVTYDSTSAQLRLEAATGLDAEAVRDLVAGFLVAGSNVVLTHDDAGNTLTVAAAGGGGGSLAVEDEGTQVLATASRLNFAGAGVTVTDAGSGEATVTIPGGGGGGGSTPTIVATVITPVSGTSGTITIPATAAVGDALILVATHGFTPTIPTNWISLNALSGTNIAGFTAGKEAVSGDIGATVTVNFAGSYQGELILVVVRGVAKYHGVAANRIASGTTMDVTPNPGSGTDRILYIAGGRGTGLALTCNRGTAVAVRNGDTNAAAAIYQGSAADGGIFSAGPTWTATPSSNGVYAATVALTG